MMIDRVSNSASGDLFNGSPFKWNLPLWLVSTRRVSEIELGNNYRDSG
jgi:hypothetical protein